MGKVIDMTLREFAEAFDFGLLVGYEDSGEKFYQLEDFQGANLGGIESEKFLDAAHIADRLDTYYYDYIVSDLQEEF